ncbi:MAG: glycosyltransferase family 2 protein [Candidatus Bathyarchaeota archaeon]|jgi:glycosyltransferase involved in cell wall biosynthesis
MGSVVSVVVPIYNEAKVLRVNTDTLREYLGSYTEDHEIILCENGSTDGTYEIADRLASRFDDVKTIHLPDKSLGAALKAGVNAARHERVVYFPVDLSVELEFIPESTRLLSVFDVVVGSKRLGHDLRPVSRRVPSRAFHGLVGSIFGFGFSDTTCAKAFRREAILGLMERVPTSSGVFETELLAEAMKEDLRVVEIPVAVEERRPSREVLLKKIRGKAEDLLSAGLDRTSILVGAPMLALGLLGLAVLSYWKMSRLSVGGFVNPYSFLLAMLLVLWGFQFVTLGLLSRLVIQIRRQVRGALKAVD